jgi:hypothetical protein
MVVAPRPSFYDRVFEFTSMRDAAPAADFTPPLR